MKYAKPALTIDEQVELLLDRGMVGDPVKMRRRLGVVNYYRLCGYWFHRKQPDDSFKPGTKFEVVWDQYVFDRKLRLLVMDAVERIEVGLRAQFAYHHALQYGPFGYVTELASLPKLKEEKRAEVFAGIRAEIERSREPFIAHFQDKYGDEHEFPPIWVATEIMSFGRVLHLWQTSPKKVKTEVAKTFDVGDKVLQSWFWCLNEVRNVCAHHGRLWNREFGNRPRIPSMDRHPSWHEPIAISNERLFGVLTLCAHCLSRLAPHSQWQRRVRSLLEKHPSAPIKNMGFPENWLESPLWRGAADVA